MLLCICRLLPKLFEMDHAPTIDMVHSFLYGPLMCQRTNEDALLRSFSDFQLLDPFYKGICEFIIYTALAKYSICGDARLALGST